MEFACSPVLVWVLLWLHADMRLICLFVFAGDQGVILRSVLPPLSSPVFVFFTCSVPVKKISVLFTHHAVLLLILFEIVLLNDCSL